MNAMKDLTYTYKLPSRSIASIHERFNVALARHQSGTTKFRGRKLTGEALMNAAMLRFLELSTEEQARVLAAYVPRFEAMLEDDGEPGSHPAPDVPTLAMTPPASPVGPSLDPQTGEPLGRPARRRKGSA